MAEIQQILVPEYFPKFQCKCGACRSCCCKGWGVCVSRDDYFRLVGMNCTASLRKRLDVADLRADLGERVSLLQRSKIVTALDGNNTLLMSPTQNGSDR